MKKMIFLCLGWILLSSYGPGNCLILEGKFKEACQKSEEAIQYAQGSKKSQLLFDEAIAICPDFDYPYYEKAVPYAKRGDIGTWKKLIDKAIEIDPVEHLANRGWYHFFFLNNYEAAIKDIETLDSLTSYDIGLTGDAIYHLNILKAICYFEVNKTDKALDIIEKQVNDSSHFVSLYDYICLGRIYLHHERFADAKIAFEKQAKNNDLAENHYYLAQIYLIQENKDLAGQEIQLASDYYAKGKTMENPYRELPFEIYKSDIEDLKEKISLL